MPTMHIAKPPLPGDEGWVEYVETDPAIEVSKVFKTATPQLIRLGIASVATPLLLSLLGLLLNMNGSLGMALAVEDLALKLTAVLQLATGAVLALVIFLVLHTADRQLLADKLSLGTVSNLTSQTFARLGLIPATVGAIAMADPMYRMLNAASSAINGSVLSSLTGSTASLLWSMLVGTLMQLVVMSSLIAIPLMGVHGLVQTKESMNDSYNRYTGNLYGNWALNFYRLVIGIGVSAFGLSLWASAYHTAMALLF